MVIDFILSVPSNCRRILYSSAPIMFLIAIIETLGAFAFTPLIAINSEDNNEIKNKWFSIFENLSPENTYSLEISNTILLFFIIGTFILRLLGQKYYISETERFRKEYLLGIMNGTLAKGAIEFYSKHPGVYIKKVTSELDALINGVIKPLILSTSNFIFIGVVFAVIFFWFPFETIIVGCFGLIIYFLSIKVLLSRYKLIGFELVKSRENIHITIQEIISGYRFLKISKSRKIFFDTLKENVADFQKSNSSYQVHFLLPTIYIEIIGVIFLVIGVYFSNKDLITVRDDVSVAVLTTLVFLVYRVKPAIQVAVSGVSSIKMNYKLIEQFITENQNINKIDIEDEAVEKKIQLPNEINSVPSIVLQNVNFKYKSDSDFYLHNINLEISGCKLIAITGKSGSGKSSLINLIVGLYKPDSGKVKVNGGSASNSDLIGYVPQKGFLFAGSLWENIALKSSMKEVDLDKVNKSLISVGLPNLVAKSFKEFDKIGFGGEGLSGGQQQRICIARAIYNENKIILLDESTGGVDVDTEKSILNHLKTNFDGLIVVITHRQNTLYLYDEVYEMIDGGIRELRK